MTVGAVMEANIYCLGANVTRTKSHYSRLESGPSGIRGSRDSINHLANH